MIFNMNSIYTSSYYEVMASILGAISVITAVESLTSIMLLVHTLYQLLPEYVEKTAIMNSKKFITIYGYGYAIWLCYGGHLGRHFENDSFPDVGFQGNFSMLLMISSTIQIR